MAKNGDGEFAFFICQIRYFAIASPILLLHCSHTAFNFPRSILIKKRLSGYSAAFSISCLTSFFWILRCKRLSFALQIRKRYLVESSEQLSYMIVVLI